MISFNHNKIFINIDLKNGLYYMELSRNKEVFELQAPSIEALNNKIKAWGGLSRETTRAVTAKISWHYSNYLSQSK